MAFSEQDWQQKAAALLAWYAEMGVDEAVGDTPVNAYDLREMPKFVPPQDAPAARKAPEKSPAPIPSRPLPLAQPARGGSFENTKDLAAACDSLDSLRATVESYKGLAITKSATHTVFADGNPQADLMLVGEAPGNEEDRQGLPFVGPAGKLLDKMLAAIGRDRSTAYISNILNWRPPGNRTPTPEEAHACLPFIRRHIQLVRPKLVVLLGGTAAKHLLGTSQGIMRLRGKWTEILLDEETVDVIDAMPTLHPAYLLRTPAAKKQAWADFLAISGRLAGKGE